MKYAEITARYVLGAIYGIFGLNYFLQFFPTGGDHEWMNIMVASGYFDVVKACQALTGLMLLTGLYVPLALLIATPITVNIVLFDIFLMGEFALPSYVMGGVVVVANLLLLWGYREYFLPAVTTRRARLSD